MAKSNRRYVPCWICGKEHTNPSSSSICCECGPKYALENRKRKQEAEEFDRKWLKEYDNG